MTDRRSLVQPLTRKAEPDGGDGPLGTLADEGHEAMIAALEDDLCVAIDGFNDDSSGVSRDDKRSVGSWRAMLLAAQEEPWYDAFHESLPVAGDEKGTLASEWPVHSVVVVVGRSPMSQV